MALLDILTDAEARRAALNVDATVSPTDLARMVTAVSARIDKLVGPVVQREVVEYRDGGAATIVPHETPVASVTSITEWDGSTQTILTADTWGTAGAADGYWLDQSATYAHACKIERRSSGSRATFAAGSGSVKLVYVPGRFADTASVSPLFKEAAAEVLRRLWNREAGAWARGADPFDAADGLGTSRLFKAVDYVVAELLGREKRLPAVA